VPVSDKPMEAENSAINASVLILFILIYYMRIL